MRIFSHHRLLATTFDRGSYQPVNHLARPAKKALAESVFRASLWLSRSGIQNTSSQNGAVGCWYDLSKRQIPYAYSEITGYAASSFLKLSEMSAYYGDNELAQEFRNKAFAAGNWIIRKAQYPEGVVKAGYYYRKDNLSTNLDARIYKDGTVSLEYFSELSLNAETTWTNLIERGYINGKGEIQHKFIELSNTIMKIDNKLEALRKIWTRAEAIYRLESARQTHLQGMGFASLSENQAVYEILNRSKDRIAFLFDNGIILSGLIGLYESTIPQEENMPESLEYLCAAQNIVNFIFKTTNSGIIGKAAFAEKIPEIDSRHLWTELVNREYIYSDGTIRSKFKDLKNSSEMYLSSIYDERKDNIFDIIQQSYIPTWPVFDFTQNETVKYSPKDPNYRWSYDFGAYNVKLVIALLRYAMVNDYIFNPQYLLEQYAHTDDRNRFLAVHLAKDLVEEALKLQSRRSGRFMINRTLAIHRHSSESFLQTYAHHHLYATEGIFWAGIILHREDFISAAFNAFNWILGKQLAATGGIARYYDNFGRPMMPESTTNEPFESSDIIAQTLRLGVLFANTDRLSYGLYKLSFDFKPPKLNDMFEGALDSLAARLIQYQYTVTDNPNTFDSQAFGGFYYGTLAKTNIISEEFSNFNNREAFDDFIIHNSHRYQFFPATGILKVIGEMTKDDMDLLLGCISEEDHKKIRNLFQQSKDIRKPHINSWSTMFAIQALQYYFMHRNMRISPDDFSKIFDNAENCAELMEDLTDRGYIDKKGEVSKKFNNIYNSSDFEIDAKFESQRKNIFRILKNTARIYNETTFDIHLFV